MHGDEQEVRLGDGMTRVLLQPPPPPSPPPPSPSPTSPPPVPPPAFVGLVDAALDTMGDVSGLFDGKPAAAATAFPSSNSAMQRSPLIPLTGASEGSDSATVGPAAGAAIDAAGFDALLLGLLVVLAGGGAALVTGCVRALCCSSEQQRHRRARSAEGLGLGRRRRRGYQRAPLDVDLEDESFSDE